MTVEAHSEEKATPLPDAAIPVLDRYAGIFRGRKARLSRVRARSAPPKAPLTAAPRSQDGRRAIKDGLCVQVQAAHGRHGKALLPPAQSGSKMCACPSTFAGTSG